MNADTGQANPKQSSNYRRYAEIEKFIRGSILRGTSSIELGWNGLVIERHSIDEGERPGASSEDHFVVLLEDPCHGQLANGPRGQFLPFSKRTGAISLFGTGVIPQRISTRVEMVVCAVSPALLGGVERELDRRLSEHSTTS